MFSALSEGLQRVIEKVSGKGKLTEKNVEEALKEIRLVLLQADVHFRVVKDLTQRVLEKAVGQQHIRDVTPSQQFIKFFSDELIDLLGAPPGLPSWNETGPTLIMMVGLQGSGKTTTCAKLASLLHKKFKRNPLLVAADLARPAAVEQLKTLGAKVHLPVYSESGTTNAVAVVERALQKVEKSRNREVQTSKNSGVAETESREAQDLSTIDTVIIDTQGRLHIDEAMMSELQTLSERIHPHGTYFVCDAMIGQDALTSAKMFSERLPVHGIIMTKLDSDAKGGAAISIRSVTGIPIQFLGTGEQMEDLEVFHPDRFVNRLLGMGDIISLVERAQEVVDQEKAAQLMEKAIQKEFDLNDFLDQMKMMKKLGKVSDILSFIPFVGSKMPKMDETMDRSMKRMEAMILSMTLDERENPLIINESRRKRIARGSGATSYEVRKFLDMFRKLKREMSAGMGMLSKKGGMPKIPENLPSGMDVQELQKLFGEASAKKGSWENLGRKK